MIQITFNPYTRSLAFDLSSPGQGSSIVKAVLLSGNRINLRGVSFGLRVYTDSETLLEQSFPPEGASYENTDQSTIAQLLCHHPYDVPVYLYAWLNDTRGDRIERTESFTVPIPEAPAPGLSWNGSQWVEP